MILNGATALSLIETIHRAALDPSCWQDVVDELHHLTEESPIGLHQLYTRNGQIVTSATSGYDARFLKSYVDHFSSLSPWLECFRTQPERQALLVSEMGLPADFEQSEFFHDWVLPQDIRFGASIRTRNVGSRALIAGISTRARDRDRLEQPSQHLLAWLEPHLAHALAVNEEIARLSANSMNYPATWGHEPLKSGGIVIVTSQRLLCWADAGAVPLFGEILRVTPAGQLGFIDPDIQAWFELVAAVSHSADRSIRGPSLEVELRCGARVWTIRALECDDRIAANVSFPGVMMSMRQPGDRALALVVAPRDSDHGVTAQLRRSFGLSSAETEVALYLSQGLSTEEIAHLRQVSRNTIRNQIQSVLTKLGARHRGDVVRIVSQVMPKT